MAVYAGRSVRIRIDLNGVGGSGANWASLTQERDSSHSKTSETVDGRHKDDDGWPAKVVTGVDWGASGSGALNPADAAWTYLDTKWRAKSAVWVQIDRSGIGGTKHEGQAVIADLSEEFPNTDLVTFNFELEGASALVVSP